jgi:Uma2 family endonuclease
MGTEATKIWTDAELLALPKDGHKYELVNGELVMSPARFFKHGRIVTRLIVRLATYVDQNKAGETFEGQSGCRMKSGNLRCPDISFLTRKRLEAIEPAQQEDFLNGSPDYVVEVLSPSDTVKDIAEKMAEYFDNDTKLGWVVNPSDRTVLVYHGPTPDKLLRSGDTLDGEAMVPGFSMPVDELFHS